MHLVFSWRFSLQDFNFSPIDGENVVLRPDEMYDFVQILPVCVGNEYLPEMIRRNQFHDLFYALGIELVENIIEQQDRRGIALFPQKIVLGQFQGDQLSLALSLRAYAFHGILAQHHVHVVPMYASGSISQY